LNLAVLGVIKITILSTELLALASCAEAQRASTDSEMKAFTPSEKDFLAFDKKFTEAQSKCVRIRGF
jgi:hypothetical protein